MEHEFKKMAGEWKKERLTDSEKALMLERIFAAPVPSPYARFVRAFAYIRRPAAAALLAFAVLGSTAAYASQKALPGDPLYPVKVRMIEPIVSALKMEPEQKLEWEQEKVVRRISEAEALAEENKLDAEKEKEIGEHIEKSSAKFVERAKEVSKQAATSSEKQEEKEAELKQKFREHLQAAPEREDSVGLEEADKKSEEKSREKIERLKERAVKVLEEKGKNRQAED